MNKQKGLTLLEALVVIAILLAAFIFFVGHICVIPQVPRGFVCATNLKGLGTAMTVYAHDYDGRFPQLPGTGPWAKELGFPYDMYHPNFSPNGAQGESPRTVTASWYLLVREADVSPSAFICPQSGQKEFDGENANNLDLTQLRDFGPTPHAHVSYAMHHPYGRFPADENRPAAFAVAADISPWFKDGDIQPPGRDNTPPQIITLSDPKTWPLGNSQNHLKKNRNTAEGQNVLYADGHSSYEKQPNCGIDGDNIYTFWSTDENPTEQDKQGGTAPTGRMSDNDAKSEEDSFLVL